MKNAIFNITFLLRTKYIVKFTFILGKCLKNLYKNLIKITFCKNKSVKLKIFWIFNSVDTTRQGESKFLSFLALLTFDAYGVRGGGSKMRKRAFSLYSPCSLLTSSTSAAAAQNCKCMQWRFTRLARFYYMALFQSAYSTARQCQNIKCFDVYDVSNYGSQIQKQVFVRSRLAYFCRCSRLLTPTASVAVARK